MCFSFPDDWLFSSGAPARECGDAVPCSALWFQRARHDASEIGHGAPGFDVVIAVSKDDPHQFRIAATTVNGASPTRPA